MNQEYQTYLPLTAHRAIVVVTPPTVEPVSLDEVKAYCRVTISDDDTLLESLITAARAHIEDITNHALCTQTRRLTIDNWPKYRTNQGEDWHRARTIILPYPPVQSISSVQYVDDAGTTQTMATNGAYLSDTDSQPGRLTPTFESFWPSSRRQINAVKVTYVCGYGAAAAVPEPFKLAIKMAVAHWYDNRGIAGDASQLPMAFNSILAPITTPDLG